MKPCRKGEVAKSVISSMRARRRVDGEHRAHLGALLEDRGAGGAARRGRCARRSRNSSASSTSSSRRQPLRTVRRTSVVSMSATARPSRSSTRDVGGAPEGLAVLDAAQQAVGQAAARRRCPAGPSRGARTGVCALCWTRYSSSLSRLVLPRRRAPTTQSESRSPSRMSRRMSRAAEEVLAAHPAPGDEGVAHARAAARSGRRCSAILGSSGSASKRTVLAHRLHVRGGDGRAALLEHAVHGVDAELLDQVGLEPARARGCARPPPARSGRRPRTGSRISASASSREKAASSISSKKLYQGLPSLFQMRLMPTPLMIATRCSEKVFMKMLRRRWLIALGVLVEHVHLVDEQRELHPLRGARLQLLDHALQVVAEVAPVVGLASSGRKRSALERGSARGGSASTTSDMTRVEEAVLGHALQVGEDGEELVLGPLVGLQRLLQVVEEAWSSRCAARP